MYEWRRLGGATVENASVEAATVLEVEKLTERFEGELETAGFFYPEGKAASMRVHLRNLFSRLDLTASDVRIFHGIIRALTKPRR